MARYWLGPWVWDVNFPTGPCWRAPTGAQASLDLRSNTDCAVTVTPQGTGLFVTANATDLGSDYTNLGTDPTAVLSGAQKRSWKSLFVLPNDLSALDLRGALWETITVQSDPTGLDRVMPLVPNHRTFELFLAGQLVFSKAFDISGAEWPALKDLLQRQYRGWYDDPTVTQNQRLKRLGYWVRKYGINYRNFQPPDLPDEADLAPTTTLSDNFTYADNASLHTASSSAWTEVNGTTDVLSNKVRGTTSSATNECRYESDLSSADHYVQMDGISISGSVLYLYAACRFASAARTFYGVASSPADNNIYFQKIVAGSYTNITNTAITPAWPETYKVQLSGSTFTCYQAGVQRLTGSDGSIAGGTRGGFVMSGGGSGEKVTADNWQAADLAAGGGGSAPFVPSIMRGLGVGLGLGMR